jgi:hypothetical protein
MKIIYTVDLKLNVIKYAKENDNGTVERQFGRLPTEKLYVNGKGRSRSEKSWRRIITLSICIMQNGLTYNLR